MGSNTKVGIKNTTPQVISLQIYHMLKALKHKNIAISLSSFSFYRGRKVADINEISHEKMIAVTTQCLQFSLIIWFNFTNLLDWTPLRLVSMTIIENMIPEKPMAHSFMRYASECTGLCATTSAIRRWRIALLVANRNITSNKRREPMILSNSEPRGTKANILNRTCSSDPWKRIDVYIL